MPWRVWKGDMEGKPAHIQRINSLNLLLIQWFFISCSWNIFKSRASSAFAGFLKNLVIILQQVRFTEIKPF
jgi:hypothetical protein